MSTVEVTGLVRQIMYLSQTWNIPLALSQQDIRVAFDSMGHGLMRDSMLARGVNALDVGLHIREFSTLHAYIELPCVGRTELFDFTKGGKQGGIETPDE